MSDGKCFLFINGQYAKEIEEWRDRLAYLTPILPTGPEPIFRGSCAIEASLLDGDFMQIDDISYRLGDEPSTAVEVLGLGHCEVTRIISSGLIGIPRSDYTEVNFSFIDYRDGAEEIVNVSLP